MKRILGLDIGASAIGWAFLELDSTVHRGCILDAGIRVVPISADALAEFVRGNAVAPDKERAMHRRMRRNLRRFRQRRDRLLAILRRLGWLDADASTQTNDALDIYGLRARAARERVDTHGLALVFLALNARRGYLSNRRAHKEDPEGSALLEHIRQGDLELKERGITIGEKLFDLLQTDRRALLRGRTFSREACRAEFDRIWETQSRFHPEMDDRLKEEIGAKTIFFQRPLRTPPSLVPHCPVDPRKKVAPRSCPVFLDFNIWRQLDTLRIKDKSGERRLTDSELRDLHARLLERDRLSASAVLRFLDIGITDPACLSVTSLEGHRTRAALLRAFSSAGIQRPELLDVDYSLTGNDFDKQPAMHLWHLLYSAEDAGALEQNLMDHFGFTRPQAQAVCRVRLAADHGSHSVRVMRRAMPYLVAGQSLMEAISAAGFRTGEPERPVQDTLEVIRKGTLRNPVVERVLNQLVHLLNAILDDSRLGRPDEVRIQLARDLKRGAEKRKLLFKRIAAETTAFTRIERLLRQDLGLENISRRELLKYRLWEECGGRSLFTGAPIELDRLFSTPDYEIDRIIPRSRIFDDSFVNMTLGERSVLLGKGDRTAFDFMKSRGEAELSRFLADIDALPSLSSAKSRRLKMGLAELPSAHVSRQLRTSQYIVRDTLSLVRRICPDVTASTGSVTRYLGNAWGLARLLPSRDPEGADRRPSDDHRHRALNALVVGCTEADFIRRLDALPQGVEGAGGLRFTLPWPGFRKEVSEMLERILVSYKVGNPSARFGASRTRQKRLEGEAPRRVTVPRGPLHKETFFGKIRQYERRPTPLDRHFIRPDLIVDPKLRELVTRHFDLHGRDPVAAFGKKCKQPLMHEGVPLKEVHCYREIFVVRKPVAPGLDLEKVVDKRVRDLLQQRLAAHGGNGKLAFGNLDADPIWLDRSRGVPIRSVRVIGAGEPVPIRKRGEEPIDHVLTRNNHHAAIFLGPAGRRDLEVVSFFEATARKRSGRPVISPENDKGWPLEFSLRINDCFLFDIDPEQVDVRDPRNRALISRNLYRVQSLGLNESGGPDFRFRHHLETTLNGKGRSTLRRVKGLGTLMGCKVHIDRRGIIFRTGE